MINEVRLEGTIKDAAVIPRRDQSKTPGRRFTVAVPCGNVHDYYNCTAWDEAATQAMQFREGDQVLVSGRLRVDCWKDSKSGESRRRVGIAVDSVTAAGDSEVF